MSTFLEGKCKKGDKSVCSFVNRVRTISEEIVPTMTALFLLSDACPGQNRNLTMIQYLCAVAILGKIEITQLFAVRGYSYSQCDRNFALYSHKLKNLKMVETPAEYMEAVVNLILLYIMNMLNTLTLYSLGVSETTYFSEVVQMPEDRPNSVSLAIASASA